MNQDWLTKLILFSQEVLLRLTLQSPSHRLHPLHLTKVVDVDLDEAEVVVVLAFLMVLVFSPVNLLTDPLVKFVINQATQLCRVIIVLIRPINPHFHHPLMPITQHSHPPQLPFITGFLIQLQQIISQLTSPTSN